MTILYPEKFHQTKSASFNGVFDWDFLLPAFKGTKIQPMDIDAIVERKGRILIFETKSIGKEIPQGQLITLETLMHIGHGRITIFVLYGKTPEEIREMEEWHYIDNKIHKLPAKSVNANFVLTRVKNWFFYCNSNTEIF